MKRTTSGGGTLDAALDGALLVDETEVLLLLLRDEFRDVRERRLAVKRDERLLLSGRAVLAWARRSRRLNE
jgi:hypothetical protein